MSNEVLSKKDFEFMDEADSKQIISANDDLKKALVYDIKGSKQITLIGLKFLILKMSQSGQPITICDSVTTLDKDAEEKQFWFWRSIIKVKNEKSGLETEGVSESPYLENGSYDKFGRIKAASKAERNAWRKQVPELEILELLKNTTGERTQKLESETKPHDPNQLCICPPLARVPSIEDYNGKLKCKNCSNFISSIVSESIIAQRKQ